jgi:hypothetical protein
LILAVDLHFVPELDPCSDQREQGTTIEASPTLLGHIEQLVGEDHHACLIPAPWVTFCLSRTVAKLLSIG